MLSDATIAVGDGITVSVRPAPHALLGEAQAITRDGVVLTWMSPIDWARPLEIPTVAEPSRLPAGAGAGILNAIAERARDAGVDALVYAGPYPTPALWRAAARSFRASGGDEAAFCADVVARTARIAREPIAGISFAPMPHMRETFLGGWSERRSGGVERVVLDGIGYEPGGSVTRLVCYPAPPVDIPDDPSVDPDVLERARSSLSAPTWRAEVWFGDALYATVATISDYGTRLDGPFPLPAIASRVLGQAFPPALREAIAELVTELVPAPIADAARARVVATSITWADLGARAARSEATGFALHAALWERVAPHGLPRLALAIAEALAPVVTSAVVADLARVSVPA